MNSLEFLDVWKTYPDGGQVLRGLTFSLLQGEIALLVGENGAGKSTILDIACGNTRPERGKIRVGGRTLGSKSPEARNHLGMRRMYQMPGTFDSLSIRDNVLIAHHPSSYATFSPWPKTHARSAAWRAIKQKRAPLFAVCPFLNDEHQTVGDLSFGERRITEFLGIISAPPEHSVLLLDEPFAGIHVDVAQTMWALLTNMIEAGASILLVEHAPHEERFARCRKLCVAAGVIQ